MKSHFLSHSSFDKEYVKKVAKEIGVDNCWLDEWEINPGDGLFGKIDKALESPDTKVFVIFWSNNSSKSPWVEEETSQARIRKIRRHDIKIIPVKLDNTSMPLWMEQLAYIDGSKNIVEVVKDINSSALHESSIISKQQDIHTFQGRLNELEAIETAYRSDEVNNIIIKGLPGYGKSMLVSYFLKHRLPNFKVIWVDLESCTPATFHATIADRMGLRIPQSIYLSGKWDEYWTDWILPTIDYQSDIIVLDGLDSIVGQDNALPDWISNIMCDITKNLGKDILPLIITTSWDYDLPNNVEKKSFHINISPLQDIDIVRSLRTQLSFSHPKINASEEQLEQAAKMLNGYPLGARLWSAYAKRVGVELALIKDSSLQNKLQTIVGDILSKCNLSEKEHHVLLLISLLKSPLPVKVLTENFNIDSDEIISLQRSLLLSPCSNGFYVHDLVAKYLIENLSTDSDICKTHDILGEYFVEIWRKTEDYTPESVALGSHAYYHLLSAGKIDKANTIGWSLEEETAKAFQELYRVKKCENIVNIYKQIEGLNGDNISHKITFYYALSLSRSRKYDEKILSKKIFSKMLDEMPANRIYWCSYGDVLRRLKETEEAKNAYLQARALSRKNDAVASARLGELLLHEGNYPEAKMFLEEAYNCDPKNYRTLSSYTLVLHQTEESKKALTLVKKGLEDRPNDIPLHHRAGQILRSLGQNNEALKHLTRAANGVESLASYSALAALHLELGSVKDAKRVMKSYPSSYKDGAYYSVLGNIARHEHDFSNSEKYFKESLKVGGDKIVYYGCMANLRLLQTEKAISMLAYEGAKAYLVEADNFVKQGLEIDPNNKNLLFFSTEIERYKNEIIERIDKKTQN